MSSKAHIGSQLPLSKYCIPIDYANTTQLNHYDIGVDDINGITPLGVTIDSSCVACYDMNNINGTTLFDKSAHDSHGTLVGAIPSSGRNGKSVYFDGTDDYIRLDNINFSSLTNCTVSFWRKNGNSNQWLLFKGQTGSYYLMAVSTGNFYHNNCGAPIIYRDGVVALTDLRDGQWHHYVAVGVNLSTWTTIEISNYTNFQYNGYLDSLVIYNRALTNDEVWSLYNDSIYTLRRGEGKHGGCVAIEESTTNLASISYQSYWNNSGTATWNFADTSIPNVPYPCCPVYSMRKDTDGDSAFQIASTTTAASTVYSFSVWFWQDRVGVGNQPYIRPYPANGNAGYLKWVGNNSTDWNTWPRGQWIRLYGTFTSAADATTATICTYLDTAGDMIAFNGWQCEQKDFPTSYTTGSRSTGRLYYNRNVLNPSNFTVSCWFNIPHMHAVNNGHTGITGNWYHPIIELSPTTNRSAAGLSICAGPTIDPYLRKIILRYPGSIPGTVAIQDNTWYHMAATYNGSVYKVYINGNLEISYSSTVAPSIFTDTVLMVGGGYYGGPNILIDEFRVDKIARTQDEIMAWYLCDSPFFPRGIQRMAT